MDIVKEDDKIYMLDNNKKIAEINFYKENNSYNIFKTYVDPLYRGKGLASKLMEEACNYIESKNYNVKASCSYAVKWLEEKK